MRNIAARILFFIAVGLLFSHQFIAHHHEDSGITSNHHDDDNDADHHQNHFPAHEIAHIFSFDNAETGFVKTPVQGIYFDPPAEFIFQKSVQFRSKEYVEIRPPSPGHHKYFSLRGPPSFLS